MKIPLLLNRLQGVAADLRGKIARPKMFDPVRAAARIIAPTGAPRIDDQIDIMARRTVKYLASIKELEPAYYPAAVLQLQDRLFADYTYFLKYLGRLADQLADARLADRLEFITGVFRQCRYHTYPPQAQALTLIAILDGMTYRTEPDGMTPEFLAGKAAPLVRALRGRGEFSQIELLLLMVRQLYPTDEESVEYFTLLREQLKFLKTAAAALKLNEAFLTSPVRNKLKIS